MTTLIFLWQQQLKTIAEFWFWLLTLGSLRNRMAVRLRMAELRKNVARDCTFPVLSDIFIRHSAVLSLTAVLLRKVPIFSV